MIEADRRHKKIMQWCQDLLKLIHFNAKEIKELKRKVAQLDSENALHRPLGPTPPEPPEFKMPLTVADLRGNIKKS